MNTSEDPGGRPASAPLPATIESIAIRPRSSDLRGEIQDALKIMSVGLRRRIRDEAMAQMDAHASGSPVIEITLEVGLVPLSANDPPVRMPEPRGADRVIRTQPVRPGSVDMTAEVEVAIDNMRTQISEHIRTIVAQHIAEVITYDGQYGKRFTLTPKVRVVASA